MAISSADQNQGMRKLQHPKQETRGLQRTTSNLSIHSNQSHGSNSQIIRMKHQEIYNQSQQSNSMVSRQKSLVINSSDNNAMISRANNLI
jgi:hypothetical protein